MYTTLLKIGIDCRGCKAKVQQKGQMALPNFTLLGNICIAARETSKEIVQGIKTFLFEEQVEVRDFLLSEHDTPETRKGYFSSQFLQCKLICSDALSSSDFRRRFSITKGRIR